jgi:hypothetical protein
MSQSDNPFAPPVVNESSYAPAPDPYYAANKVKPPALTLLIVTSVMMVLVVLGLLLNLVGMGMGAAANNSEGASLMFQGVFGLVQGLIGLAVGAFVIYGSQQMMKLQSYSLATAACIVSMVPCISPCCITGIPLGIWGLVVLNDPLVKSAFTE